MQIKADYRKQLLKKRDALDGRSEKSALIASKLLSLDEYRQAQSVLCYVSMRSEADTHKLIEQMLRDGKTVAVPYCVNRCGKMDFYVIHALFELTEGAFGVQEPDINFHKRLEDFENSIIIVPGVAFSEQGQRLGYGGGYYDRFLASYRIYSIGICFEDMISNALPAERFDMPVDMVISEERVIYISGGKNGR